MTFDERWLLPGAVVMVDVPTTGALVQEIQRLRLRCSEAVHRVPMAPNVDGQDFYELCQAYRHSKEIAAHPSMPNTVQAFNNLREYIKTGELPWPSYERQSAPHSEGQPKGDVQP